MSGTRAGHLVGNVGGELQQLRLIIEDVMAALLSRNPAIDAHYEIYRPVFVAFTFRDGGFADNGPSIRLRDLAPEAMQQLVT